MRLLPSSVFNNFVLECSEVDGVVLGSWADINENPSVPVVDDDNVGVGYWAAAAVWCNVWDQRTIDRVSYLLYNFPTCISNLCYCYLFLSLFFLFCL